MNPTAAASARAQGLLDRTRHELHARLARGQGFWVFAYASLLWRPESEPAEIRPARVWGHHRALRMRSRTNRGTPERPGLVFALLPGGSCVGQAHRMPDDGDPDRRLDALWAREMPGASYDPRWLTCRTPGGPVEALAFTLPAASPSLMPRLDEAALLDILRHARGRYGTTLDYLLRTARRLDELGIGDAEVSRLVRLALRHGLAPSDLAGR